MAPYRRFLRENIVVRRDSLLVVAKNETELLKSASAATYAVQIFDILGGWKSVSGEAL